MFESQTDKQPSERVRRFDKTRETSNRLFVFEYSPDKAKTKREQITDLADTKYQKPANYLLKMEQLKEKRRELEGSVTPSQHRSNIQRLKSLIKGSRTFGKASDSGIERMIRTLEKLLKSSQSIRNAFQSLKRSSMASSMNMELFIQSRHMKDTVKINSTSPKGIRPELLQINQNSEDNGLNADSFNYFREVSKQLAQAAKQEKQPSFSFRDYQSPQKKFQSKGNITTMEDLSFSAGQASPIRAPFKQLVQIPTTCESIPMPIIKTIYTSSLYQGHLNAGVFSKESISSPLICHNSCQIESSKMDDHEQKESDSIQLCFTEVVLLLSKTEKKKVTKPNSPINNLVLATPSASNASAEYRPFKAEELKKSKAQNQQQNTRKVSKLTKKQSRKQELASNTEYANRMLFGDPSDKPDDKPKQSQVLRNRLMQNQAPLRARISSLPRITFTYTSREKYQREASPQIKDSLFPIMVYRRKVKPQEVIAKNNSKQELHTTISSRQNISNSNNSNQIGHYLQSQRNNHIRSPNRIQQNGFNRIQQTSPRNQDPRIINNQFGSTAFGQVFGQDKGQPANEYYGNYANLRKFDLDQRRQRVMTALPGMKGVQFGTNQRLAPCCWVAPVKQVRSHSANDRVLLGNAFSPIAV